MILWENGWDKDRPMNKEVAFKNLFLAYAILNKHGVKCCLSHGALLGAYRDKDFIDWDDDIDLWADMATSKNRLAMEQELRDAGFYVPPIGDKDKPVNPETNMPYSDTVAIKDGEKIEIWWFVKQGDQYVYDIYRDSSIKLDKKFYEPLSSIYFKGVEFNCPSYLEEWLTIAYGDWKTPSKGRFHHL
jgi:phosphorylcholine metabolism protein LicD